MAAEMAQEIGADILDVNCGCPAPKVVKHGGGSGLLKDHCRLEEILKGIRKTITIPLTVKIRAGFYDHTINAVETAKLAEGCGAEHIALHGRTKEQGYRGLANWDLVRQIKEVVKVPVSGSGDITTVQQAFDRFQETGCDGVLIGRGAMANPWIFRSCTSENRRFWCSGLQRLISSISTDSAPQTVAGVSRNRTEDLASSG
jgi:nifR3 family TIM-barrel protein